MGLHVLKWVLRTGAESRVGTAPHKLHRTQFKQLDSIALHFTIGGGPTPFSLMATGFLARWAWA